jgi:NADPH:quinone reductase-like Zn-dependent oxidoreductase
MKALVIDEHGTLDRIRYGEVPVPEIRPDEVLLAVRAAALNQLDRWVTEGWRGLELAFPHILGCDGAGVIVAVGDEVRDFAPGSRVAVNPTLSCGRCAYCQTGRDHMCDQFAIFGEHVPGLFAEHQAVPARNLIPLPDHVDFETAAAASLVYVTAWHSLIASGRFQAGETLLVVGAAGGANSAYIDIARLAGAGAIFVVGSSEAKLAHARQLGADVTINRHNEDWGKALFRATGRQGVDVAVDNVGAASYMTSLRALKKGGRLLTVGNSSGPTFELDNRYLFAKHLTVIGSTMGPQQEYAQVMQLVFAGRLHPVVDTVYPLADGLTALRRLEAGDVLGKLVLRPDA